MNHEEEALPLSVKVRFRPVGQPVVHNLAVHHCTVPDVLVHTEIPLILVSCTVEKPLSHTEVPDLSRHTELPEDGAW